MAPRREPPKNGQKPKPTPEKGKGGEENGDNGSKAGDDPDSIEASGVAQILLQLANMNANMDA